MATLPVKDFLGMKFGMQTRLSTYKEVFLTLESCAITP